jgi:hypothetical protein
MALSSICADVRAAKYVTAPVVPTPPACPLKGNQRRTVVSEYQRGPDAASYSEVTTMFRPAESHDFQIADDNANADA